MMLLLIPLSINTSLVELLSVVFVTLATVSELTISLELSTDYVEERPNNLMLAARAVLTAIILT